MIHSRMHTSLILLATAGLLAAGCTQAEPEEQRPGVIRAALHKAQDCAQLEQMLKADALLKMNRRIDAEIAMIQSGWGYGYDESGSAPTGGMDGGVAGTGGMAGSGGSGGSGTGTGGAAPAPAQPGDKANEHSETNTQVEGVDEADIVKTDGQYIYLLHGESFLVLNAWPASQLSQASSIAVEGLPLEMYVTDDKKVVVYSSVDGAPIYAEAGIPAREHYDDSYYGYGVPVSPGGPSYDPGYYGSYPLTKITVLQLNGTEPSVVSESYFEGSYTSSRRIGQVVRTVVQGAAFGPSLQYYPDSYYYDTAAEWVHAYEQLRAENANRIRNSALADWLPYYMVRTGSGLQANLARCDDFYVPTAGSTAYGMTQIQSLDLQAPALVPRGANIVGATDTVYANLDTLVLASRAWLDPAVLMAASAVGGDEVDMASPPQGPMSDVLAGIDVNVPISTSFTHLHTFDIAGNPSEPAYVASGTVPGTLLNQFSLDVHQGHLRLAVTDDRVNVPWEESRVNHVFVLATEADDLVTSGSVRNIAPNESIYSARFMGDKGYLVTFRQVDPLFVLDLSNPASPKLLGELEIPGFSEYMHPLDDGHLLTIGQDGSGSLALQIFDVTDPLHPKQAHKYAFSNADMYGYSEAESNHKAFTYYASQQLLAFPFVGWGSYDGSMKSSLELFHVDKDQGIFKLGSIDHTQFFSGSDPYGYCGGYYGVDVRRGMFLDDVVYSISYGGVIANSINDLATPLATLALPAPQNSSYGCYGY